MNSRWLKRWMRRALHHRGYELREVGSPPRGFAGFFAYAKRRGLAPKTVFDVGVGHGTQWLYDAFPEAKLVLFEPLDVFDAQLRVLSEHYGAAVHRVALSNRVGVAELNLNELFPTSSSLRSLDSEFARFAASLARQHRFVRREVRLDTLDRLNVYESPYLLKVDVEGAEREVLEGARATLEKTALVILEMSVMRRLADEPSFARMISFLDECGFELFDIPSLSQLGADGPLVYLDAAFVPKGSPLWPVGKPP